MMKFATHNSASGERAGNVLSLLAIPFSRCQGKTIREQYEAGCRFFDIRVKKCGDGWHSAHGLFRTARTVDDILGEIDGLGGAYVRVNYEGSLTETTELEAKFAEWRLKYQRLTLTRLGVKLPKQRTLWQDADEPECDEKYLGLCWGRWQTLLPIPWLWKKVYYDKPEFNEDRFTMVDWL